MAALDRGQLRVDPSLVTACQTVWPEAEVPLPGRFAHRLSERTELIEERRYLPWITHVKKTMR